MVEKPILKKQVAKTTQTQSNDSLPLSNTQIIKMNSRDLDRNRAQQAWAFIIGVKGAEYEGKYGSLVRNLPTMIQVNGLAQTLAFLKAKGKEHDPKSRKEHFVQAFYQLSNWVCSCLSSGEKDLLQRIITTENTQQYRQATAESLAFLQWLKRFAEAELKSEEENK
jgi:CRISPR-associated protein Cmr5